MRDEGRRLEEEEEGERDLAVIDEMLGKGNLFSDLGDGRAKPFVDIDEMLRS